MTAVLERGQEIILPARKRYQLDAPVRATIVMVEDSNSGQPFYVAEWQPKYGRTRRAYVTADEVHVTEKELPK